MIIWKCFILEGGVGVRLRVGGEGGHDGLCHLASLTFIRIMRRVIVIIIMIVHGGIYNLQPV